MIDDQSSGIYLLEDWNKLIQQKTKFIDNLEVEDDLGRFNTHQPFWIHYQWKSNSQNGKRGQFQYFRSWNYKYAFKRFKAVVRRFMSKNRDITFVLTTGNSPNRQFLLSSDVMSDKGTQTLLGFLFRSRFLILPQQKDESRWWTILRKDSATGELTKMHYPNDKYKEANKKYSQLLKQGLGNSALALLAADHQVVRWNYPMIKKGFRRYYQ